ncbi:hypothetical protein M1B72_11830 [Geomonas paludis]|uniref:Uracil-DNA glycosylase-like domain-containing protein n=1 Tax=Geomonas paludis TaxID=2740185 RepID=A0ABY4L823_9BACT|nr:hypothetical protein [Geomonas paludis]UPU34143.1 hypothetical protein M1B72_11830 [Geomonas paludis]
MLNERLWGAYCNILENIDPKFLDARVPHGSRPEELSGLFVTSVNDGYAESKNKIMIVGSETAGWNVLTKGERFKCLESYVRSSMDKHKSYFERELGGKNSRGYSFHNFTRAVGKRCGKEGLIYSNLFCFDWKKGSPINTPHFDTIRRHSELLLKKQIEILEPDIIIFANGMVSVPHRREYFPLSECINGRDYSAQGIPNRHLWEFQLRGKTRSFRIHHPSARAKAAAAARTYLLNLLPSV